MFRKKLKKIIIQEIKKSELKQKIVSWTLFFRWAWGCCKLVRHLDKPGWGQKGYKKERTALDKQVEYLGSSWT